MTDDRTPIGAADPDVAAAELALGLLEGDERALALRRVLAEPGFAQDVDRWRTHCAWLYDLWPEVAAPAAVWPRIERSIDGPVASPVVTTGRFWPVTAMVASLAAACLLLFVVMRPAPPAPTPAPQIARAEPPRALPMLVAAIAPVGKGDPVTAVYDPASGGLRLTQAALADARHDAELWVIAGDGVPHSLGLLPPKGAATFSVAAADRARLAAGSVLAVSIEPVGGSTTGLPTGPVVAKGALAQV